MREEKSPPVEPADFQGLGCGSGASPRVERQLPMLFVDADGGSGGELAAEEGVRQRVLEAVLDHTAEGAGTVDGVEAFVGEESAHGVGDLEREAVGGHLGDEFCQLQVDDLADVVSVEGLEDDDLVDAVEELGEEAVLELVEDLLADR